MGKVKVIDIVIILVLLLVSLVPLSRFLCVGEGNAMVKITVSDKVFYYSINNDREEEIENNGYKLTVKISDGKVSVPDSDCEDKVCVHSGRISNSGSAIVCLPADVAIEIVSDKETNDAVAG